MTKTAYCLHCDGFREVLGWMRIGSNHLVTCKECHSAFHVEQHNIKVVQND